MESLKLKLEDIAIKHFAGSSIYGLMNEEIPSKKEKNIKDLHNIISDEKIYLVHDDTLFGSAKDGMAFGEWGIYWREKFGSPEKLSYSEIVESTANKDKKSNSIFIFNKTGSIIVNNTYYDIIAEIKEELIMGYPTYELYYENAISSLEESMVELIENDEFDEMIKLIYKYEGLILREEDKSTKMREIYFNTYMEKEMYQEAEEELKILGKSNYDFYEKAKPVLELKIRENKYINLEEDRLIALEWENFDEVYEILNKQNDLGIKDEEFIQGLELETREAEYKSLDKKREEALEYSDFQTANLLLEKQEKLNIKSISEIEEIRVFMGKLKKEVLEGYHEALKQFIDSELFLESMQMINRIYKIDPLYNLQKEVILLEIYQYRLDEAKEFISNLSDLSLKAELEEIHEMTRKTLRHEMRKAARNKDYDYFEFFPNIWSFKDEFEMTPIHYMALEGDITGLRKAYENSGSLIMDDNVFGHNILDLLGLSCDPRFGDNGENLIDLLKEIRHLIEGDSIYNRIEFLKTGIEEDFLSYKLSKEFLDRIDYKERERLIDLRMEELNSRLISSNHFKELKFNLMDLERAEAFLEFFLLYFPIKPPRVELGNYDVENEKFYLLVNGRVEKVGVAESIAENFKAAFDKLEFTCNRALEDDCIIDYCSYYFEEEEIILPFKKRSNF